MTRLQLSKILWNTFTEIIKSLDYSLSVTLAIYEKMKEQNILFDSEIKDFSGNRFSIIVSILFSSVAGYAYFAFLPLFLNSQGFSAGEIIFIMTWMGVGMAIFSWFFGRMSDKKGRRKIFFILALCFQIIVLSLFNLNNNLIYYCFLNFLRGLLLGMSIPTSNALFTDIVEKIKQKDEINVSNENLEISGTQLSLLSTTKSTGWAIGVLLSSSVISILGIDSLIFFLIITTTISLFFALPLQDVKNGELAIMEINTESFKGETDPAHELERRHNKGIRSRAKVKFILFISVFFRQFGLIAFLQIISILLIDAGISVELAGIVIAINPISQIVAMVINGRIIDKPKISERWMLMVGFVLSSLTLLCYAGGSVTGDIIFFIIGQICLGFAWGCIYTGALKYIVNRAPMDRAFYMGIWIGNLQVAKIFSYQIFALLWIIYSPVLVLPFAALIPLLGVLLIFWL